MITVHSYFSLADKSAELAQIYEKYRDNALFIVPARLDRDLLLELICGDKPFFGASPTIWTVGDLLAELQHATKEYEHIIDPPDHKLILRWLLSEFLAEAEEKGAALEPGCRHPGFVSVLGKNIKDLLAEEVSADSVRSALGEEIEEFSPESVFLELYERYMNYLEEYSLADAAQIFTIARRKLATDGGRAAVEGKKIVFAGFLSFTSSQLRLVKALGELADMEMFQPETGLDWFHDGILQLNEGYKGRPKWNVPVVKLEAGNPQLEIEATARELALWACGEGALTALGGFCGYGSIGLMTGSDRLHVVEYALSRYKIPYNVQEGGTAGETLLGGLPSAILRARRSGWNNRETALLVSNPLLFGANGALPKYDEAALPDGIDAWLAALPKEAGETLRRADALCKDLESGVTPVKALTLWRDFLRGCRVAERAAETAAGQSELDESVKQTASALDELDKKIRKLAEDSKDIGPAADVILDGAGAAAFINEWGSTATLPVQLPQSRSVTVYVGPPPTLASHRCWIMTGVDSNSYPGTLRESMLLGDGEKAKINAAHTEDDAPSHLPELHEEREQKEAVFRRVLATGRECVVVTRALFDESGGERGESPFLTAALAGGERSWRLADSVVYNAERALPDGGGPWFPQAEVVCMPGNEEQKEAQPCGRAASTELPRIRISDIDRWNACPYMHWCERQLGLESGLPSLYDNKKAGTLTHLAWEAAFRAKNENPKLSIHRYIMDNWTRFKSEGYPELDSDPRLARHEKLLCRRMFDMAAEQDELEKRLATVPKLATETEVKLDGFEYEGALFVGQADRIDRFRDGIVVLDYKLGKSSSHVNELQVAAYCAVLAARGENILGFGWLGHAGPSLSGWFSDKWFDLYAFKDTTKKKGTRDEKIAEALKLMAEMAKSARSGVYPPKYDVKNSLCQKCAYFTLCRKREKRAYIESFIEGAENNDAE